MALMTYDTMSNSIYRMGDECRLTTERRLEADGEGMNVRLSGPTGFTVGGSASIPLRVEEQGHVHLGGRRRGISGGVAWR